MLLYVNDWFKFSELCCLSNLELCNWFWDLKLEMKMAITLLLICKLIACKWHLLKLKENIDENECEIVNRD